MTTGQKLRELRGDRTQAEVSDATGVTPSAYSMYENDVRVPNDDAKKRIADYYKVTVQYLFFD